MTDAEATLRAAAVRVAKGHRQLARTASRDQLGPTQAAGMSGHTAIVQSMRADHPRCASEQKRRRPRRVTSLIAVLVFVLGPIGGCSHLGFAEKPAPESSSNQDLVVGYTLLADALDDESALKKLKLLKKITLRGPSRHIGEIMDRLAEVSQKRAAELKKLRRLAPDVSGKPRTKSPVGDAITAVAKELGKDEMLSREGNFNLRFLVLQAQATRMVAAMSQAIARFDPNKERVKWLGEVASEYERIRNDLIAAIEKQGSGK